MTLRALADGLTAPERDALDESDFCHGLLARRPMELALRRGEPVENFHRQVPADKVGNCVKANRRHVLRLMSRKTKRDRVVWE